MENNFRKRLAFDLAVGTLFYVPNSDSLNVMICITLDRAFYENGRVLYNKSDKPVCQADVLAVKFRF